MRLEVICQDRLGLTRELLDILVAKQIDLRGIELNQQGKMYLNCPDLEFEQYSRLMAQIRQIVGVSDVRKIAFMPSEQSNRQLHSVLSQLPDPILLVDLKGQIEFANAAAQAFLHISTSKLANAQLSHYLTDFDFTTWLEQGKPRVRDNIILTGLDYLLDVLPISTQEQTLPTATDDNDAERASHALIILKPVLQSEVKLAAIGSDNPLGFEHFVGVSNKHQQLMNQAKKLALLDQPLLIEGATGTGKEMLARACHQRSKRAEQPFLVLSCASMPDDVAETELFGHVPGAFNHQAGHKGIFEQADHGTVFLDEIGEMSPHLQIKLLRFLQDGCFRRVGEEQEMHVDVRVIASTRHTLTELTQEGRFREDLYYRLNVLSLAIPPLNQRSSDILPLLDRFVAKYAHQLGMQVPVYASDLLEQLTAYSWPGNIRQLDNMVLRAMTQLDGHELKIEHFQLPNVEENTPNQKINIPIDGSLDEMMRQYEAQILQHLYQSFPSSRKLASRLNVSHTSIANKLRDYNIRKL